MMVIAKKGDGSLRDAQSIFDQVRSFCGSTIKTGDALKTLNAVDLDVYFKITALISAKDQRGGIGLVDEIMKSGYDLRELVAGLGEHFRNLLVVSSTGSGQLVEASDHFRAKYQEESAHWSEADLLRLLKQANELEQSIRWASQPRYKLEAALLQMITMESSVQIGQLLQQLEELKKNLGSSRPESDHAEPARNSGGTTGRTQRGPGQGAGDVKVVGRVSAGQLHSAAVTTVPREAIGLAFSMTSAPARPNQGGTSAAQPVLKPGNGLRSISVEEAYARWQEWVGEVRKQKISLASTLDQSKISSITNGALRIACPDDYHVSNLRRNKEFLVDSFRKVTGYQVQIEPEFRLDDRDISALQAPSALPSAPQAAAPRAASTSGDHPVIQALIRELGAEKVE
jgi:DNA polymerase III gamma/tau subunit